MDANRDRASARCRDLQLLCFRPLSPSPEIRHALVWKRYAVFTKAADAFLRAAKSFTNQTECPLIPLYKGITGLPQQTEECCPRLPCVRGAVCRGGLRDCLPFLLPPFSLFSISAIPQSAKKSLPLFTTGFSWNPAMNYPPGPSPARYFRRGEA